VIDRDYLEIGFPLESTTPKRPKRKSKNGRELNATDERHVADGSDL
jgi:hypothetical protein